MNIERSFKSSVSREENEEAASFSYPTTPFSTFFNFSMGDGEGGEVVHFIEGCDMAKFLAQFASAGEAFAVGHEP